MPVLSTPACHVAIIGNQVDTMIRFRGSLIALLVANGITVTTLCPAGSADDEQQLRSLGASPVFLTGVKRSSINPLHDLRLLSELVRQLRLLKPTHLLSYFLKPAIYGTLAGRIAGVPRRVALIEGLGFSFSPGHGLKRVTARTMLKRMLGIGLGAAQRIVVLNEGDARFLADEVGVPPGKIAELDGIGLELDRYAPAPPHFTPLTFTLAARLIREKGIGEFAAAAKIVRQSAPDTRFILLGGIDEGSNAIPREQVEAWVAAGLIEWPGQVADVRPWLRDTSVFVLPSFYGEGMPRSIMEAMAMGRPVITSTMAGCRDSITPGVSGHLVEPRDAEALSRIMLFYVNDPDRVRTMGIAAADEAARRYDSRRQDASLAHLLLDQQF